MKKKPVRLFFTGDISLNGSYIKEENINKISYIFLQIQKFLKKRRINFLIGNLESPLKGTGENVLKNPRLHTNIQTIKALRLLSPAILNLANNHIYDCLKEGFVNTREWLKSNNFNYLGAGLSLKESQKPLTLTKGGNKITILSYVARNTHPSLPNNCEVYLNFLDKQRAISEIKDACKNTLVIVMIHWGLEFSHYPSPDQRSLAHLFIDSGAKLIVGHHTHVLQGLEFYKEGYIFYNLGNFAFADIDSIPNQVLWTNDQLHGGGAIIDINDNKIKNVELIPLFISNLATTIEKKKIWKNIFLKRSRPLILKMGWYQIFWQIYYLFEFVFKRPFKYFFGERKNFKRQIKKLPFNISKKINNIIKNI